MGLAQGVAAGLATGGRFSGIGTALKMVLKNQQLNRAMQNRMDITREVTDRDMALKMLALQKFGDAGELPEEMKAAGYVQHGGKVYRTRNLATPEKYPGESAAMGAGMLQANLKAIDELMREPGLDQSAKVVLKKHKIRLLQDYQSSLMAGTEDIEEPTSGMDNFMNYLKGIGSVGMNMLTGVKNSVMDLIDAED